MIFIHSTIEPIFKRSNWIGHGEWHHPILIQGHFMKRCSKDSLPESYIGQVVDLRINLSFNVVQVGTRHHAIFQRRSLCLSCIFSFHRSFHSFFSKGPILSNLFLCSAQYADLVEKVLVLLGLHIILC